MLAYRKVNIIVLSVSICGIIVMESSVNTVVQEPIKWMEIYPQIIAAVGPYLGTLNIGMVMGFSGVALPMMRSDPDIHLTSDQETWIASFGTLGTALGPILAALLENIIGLRNTICLAAIFFLIGWILIPASSLVVVIYMGRLTGGIAVGIPAGLIMVYLAEISDPRIRGQLAASSILFVNIGIFIISLLGFFFSWRSLAYFGMGFSVLFMVVLIMLSPESPQRLVRKGKITEAVSSLRRIRHSEVNVESQVRDMETKFKKELSETKTAHNLFTITQDFFAWNTIKPFIILSMLFFTQQFSGVPAIIFYSVDLLESVSYGAIDPRYLNLMMCVYRTVLVIIAMVLVPRIGVRKLLIYTGVAMTPCMLSIGAFEYWKQGAMGHIAYWIKWIPLTSMALFLLFYTPGFGTVPWILLGEMFPAKTRGYASSLVAVLSLLFVFLVVYMYPLFINVFHLYGTFLFYGSVCLCGTVFTAIWQPETHGKSLDEIEENVVTFVPDTGNNTEGDSRVNTKSNLKV